MRDHIVRFTIIQPRHSYVSLLPLAVSKYSWTYHIIMHWTFSLGRIIQRQTWIGKLIKTKSPLGNTIFPGYVGIYLYYSKVSWYVGKYNYISFTKKRWNIPPEFVLTSNSVVVKFDFNCSISIKAKYTSNTGVDVLNYFPSLRAVFFSQLETVICHR